MKEVSHSHRLVFFMGTYSGMGVESELYLRYDKNL